MTTKRRSTTCYQLALHAIALAAQTNKATLRYTLAPTKPLREAMQDLERARQLIHHLRQQVADSSTLRRAEHVAIYTHSSDETGNIVLHITLDPPASGN